MAAIKRNRFKVILAGDELGLFDETDLTLTDAFTLENNAGLTINEMLGGIVSMRASSLRALVWFMKFKRGDNAHISTIDFKLTELTFEAVPVPSKARTEPSATGTSESSPTSAT